METVVPGIGSLSSRREVVDTGMFVARRRRPAMRPVHRRIVAQ
jgi:hypothetical protein